MTTVKGILTIDTALTVVCTALLGYFTWSAKRWIENIDVSRADMEVYKTRLSVMEKENATKWPWVDERFDKIDEKLDWLIKEQRKK